MRRARILIAEDNLPLRHALEQILSDRFEIVGSVGDGIALLREQRRLAAEVLVTDLSMPGLTGLEALRLLGGQRDGPKVVIFTVHDDSELVQAALEAGANAYVLKSAGHRDLIPAIEAALEGLRFLSPGLRLDSSDGPSEPNIHRP